MARPGRGYGTARREDPDKQTITIQSPEEFATWTIDDLLLGRDLDSGGRAAHRRDAGGRATLATLGLELDAGGRATRLERVLAQRIADVDFACELSSAQMQKLLIAGHGDVKRFLDRADELKAIFVNGTIQDQNDFVDWAKRVMQLRGERDADQFGTGSLFAKTLKKTLSRDQFFNYCQWRRLTHADESS